MNTTYTLDEASTETVSYITFGQAARGGKIHRADYNGAAWCLDGTGGTHFFRTLAKVEQIEWVAGETALEQALRFEAQVTSELAALAEANIPTSNLCKKCCSRIIESV